MDPQLVKSVVVNGTQVPSEARNIFSRPTTSGGFRLTTKFRPDPAVLARSGLSRLGSTMIVRSYGLGGRFDMA